MNYEEQLVEQLVVLAVGIMSGDVLAITSGLVAIIIPSAMMYVKVKGKIRSSSKSAKSDIEVTDQKKTIEEVQ
jgi:hypothetical protein